jgi:hypothetical protein
MRHQVPGSRGSRSESIWIDRVFAFAETVAAFRYLESGEGLGKVVIRQG